MLGKGGNLGGSEGFQKNNPNHPPVSILLESYVAGSIILFSPCHLSELPKFPSTSATPQKNKITLRNPLRTKPEFYQ